MPGSSAANADDPNEAKTFWGMELGEASDASWQVFVAALEAHLRKAKPEDAVALPSLERVLRYAFGGHSGAVVRCQDLEKFLRRFGPLDVAISKAKTSLFGADGYLLPWFHGELSRERAEALLSGRPAGSFLFRFSESQPHNISVSYLEAASGDDGSAPASTTVLRNSLLHNAGRDGFGLASGSSSSGSSSRSSRRRVTWPTLVAFVESFARRLSKPVPSGLCEQCRAEIDAETAAAAAAAALAAAAAAAAVVAAPPAVPETPPRTPPGGRSRAQSSSGALSPLPPPPPSPPWRAPVTPGPPAAGLTLARKDSAAAAGPAGDGVVQRLRVARRLYSQAQALAVGDGPGFPVLGSSGGSAAVSSSFYGGGGAGSGSDGMPNPPALAEALSGSPAYGGGSGLGTAADGGPNDHSSSSTNGGFAIGGSSGSNGVFTSSNGVYSSHGGASVLRSHGNSGVFNSFGGSSDDAIAGKAAAAAEVLALLDQVFAILAEPGVADAHLEAKALRLRGDVQLACDDQEAAAASFAACLAAANAALEAQEAAEEDVPAASSGDRNSVGGGAGGTGGGASSSPPGTAALPASLGAVQAYAHRELASLRLAAGDPAAALEHFAGLIECTTDPDSRRAVLEAWCRKPAFREAIDSAGWSETACEVALEGGVGHFRAGEYDSAAVGFRRALLIARCVGAGRLEARALGNLATANKKARRLGEAVSQYRACLLLLRQLRDGETEKTILNFLVLCCMEASRWTHAWRFNDQLLALAENRANVEMLNRRRDQIAAAAGWRSPGHGHGSARAPSPAR